jgi:hypothetical protein
MGRPDLDILKVVSEYSHTSPMHGAAGGRGIERAAIFKHGGCEPLAGGAVAWAVAAYPGYRNRLVSAALNAFGSVGSRPTGLQRSESAAISAAAAASHQAGVISSACAAVSSAFDAAAQAGGEKEILAALAGDAGQLDQRLDPVNLANQQLWPMPRPRVPDWVNDGWEPLREKLIAAYDEYWEV